MKYLLKYLYHHVNRSALSLRMAYSTASRSAYCVSAQEIATDLCGRRSYFLTSDYECIFINPRPLSTRSQSKIGVGTFVSGISVVNTRTILLDRDNINRGDVDPLTSTMQDMAFLNLVFFAFFALIVRVFECWTPIIMHCTVNENWRVIACSQHETALKSTSHW